MTSKRPPIQSTVLVTGGTGYVGSHATVALMEAGHRVVILDDLSNSHASAIDAIAGIVGQRPAFFEADVRDGTVLAEIFARHDVTAVMHFAGLKSVAESFRRPLDYYGVNFTGTQALVSAMDWAGVRTLVFSSSATVYGEPVIVPIPESHPCAPMNPYARSKWQVEQMLRDVHQADPRWSIACLRYFNPAGAHPSGLIGEDPRGNPNNLVPIIGKVLCGQQARLSIYGSDYPSDDGTAVRDYIHPMDLADAHVLALDSLMRSPQFRTANLGTGRGNSVLEVLAAYEAESGRSVPHVFTARREGDASICYADPAFAQEWLGWKANRTLREMCADAWSFQRRVGSDGVAATPERKAIAG